MSLLNHLEVLNGLGSLGLFPKQIGYPKKNLGIPGVLNLMDILDIYYQLLSYIDNNLIPEPRAQPFVSSFFSHHLHLFTILMESRKHSYWVLSEHRIEMVFIMSSSSDILGDQKFFVVSGRLKTFIFAYPSK